MGCVPFLAAADAITRAPRLASAPETTTPIMAPSGPAETTETPPINGTDERIERRAGRLRHANQIQRARFVRIHQTLSRRCCEVRA